LFSTYKKEKGL